MCLPREKSFWPYRLQPFKVHSISKENTTKNYLGETVHFITPHMYEFSQKVLQNRFTNYSAFLHQNNAKKKNQNQTNLIHFMPFYSLQVSLHNNRSNPYLVVKSVHSCPVVLVRRKPGKLWMTVVVGVNLIQHIWKSNENTNFSEFKNGQRSQNSHMSMISYILLIISRRREL